MLLAEKIHPGVSLHFVVGGGGILVAFIFFNILCWAHIGPMLINKYIIVLM